MMIPAARTILPLLPTAAGYWLTRQLASLISSPGLKPGDQEFFDQSSPIRFGRRNQNTGWLNGSSSGPLVLLVHGWAGRGAQMIALGKALLESGFRAGIPDITAHGASGGRQATFRDFIDDIRSFCDAVGEPPYAIVGHSAGGLTSAAARVSVHAKRYVFVNAPSAPYVPIDEIQRLLRPRQAILDRCRNDYAQQFGSSWQALERADAYECDDGTAALLVYDDADPRLRPDDMQLISQRWQGAVTFRTHGLGHVKPLRDKAVIQRIIEFLGNNYTETNDQNKFVHRSAA
jgi:pimeloyl-ACP methyl ester carboxylesterase